MRNGDQYLCETGTCARAPTAWSEDFAAYAPETIAWLAQFDGAADGRGAGERERRHVADAGERLQCPGTGLGVVALGRLGAVLLAARHGRGRTTAGGAHGFGVNLKSFLQEDDCRVVAVCDSEEILVIEGT